MRIGIAGLFVGAIGTLVSIASCSGSDSATAATGEDGGASSGSPSGSSGGPAGSSGGPGSSGDSGGGGGDDDGGDAGPPKTDGGLGSGCAADGECASKVCGAAGKCVPAASCRGSTGTAPGIDTCGAAEPGSESCCTSLTLPTTTTRTLDRYEITAGRVRAFIAAASPNLRKWATDFVAAHPDSQLGKMNAAFPGYLDILPADANVASTPSLQMMVGAFPFDAINAEDGCYITPGGYGAATYWQAPADLTPYEIGYGKPPDGTRKYSQAVLDTKPANCMPPLVLAAFCAWDGGELARTSDFREVWGRNPVALTGGPTVYIPWTAILRPGEFNWRNGHDGACPVGWPGCTNGVAPVFFSFPTGGNPADDDAPEIGAPGRFPKDVTKAVSPDGGGWFDVGGNLMEAAWPNTALVPATKDVCDTSAGSPAQATQKCNRDQSASDKRPGTLRFKGDDPPVALVGYSFEVHSRRSEAYLASTTDDETKIDTGDVKPLHFQYGKVGGRCARVK